MPLYVGSALIECRILQKLYTLTYTLKITLTLKYAMNAKVYFKFPTVVSIQNYI